MKIIILGCNQVAISLTENLSSEANDITLVDPDGDALRELKDRLDIGIAQGWPSHPDVLRRAGADDADMIIAVTENDEVNMVACQIAYSIFKTPKKSAACALPLIWLRRVCFAPNHFQLMLLSVLSFWFQTILPVSSSCPDHYRSSILRTAMHN
jgi:hypothetical protein